jgi:hypothetical protein
MECTKKMAQKKSVTVQFYETGWKKWGKKVLRVHSKKYWLENNKIRE